MTFTDINAITLVAWFTGVCVFYLYAARVTMGGKFKKWYEELRDLHYKNGHHVMGSLPPPDVFPIVWTIIVGCVIASLTLWTMNFYTCYNTYFIVIIALVLFHFVCISTWAPTFTWRNRPLTATIIMTLVLASGILVLFFMAITLTFNTEPSMVTCLAANPNNTALCGGTICLVDKTAGYVAIALWALPHLWYVYALFLTARFIRLDPRFTFENWMHQRYHPTEPAFKKYLDEGGHAKESRAYHKRLNLRGEMLQEPLVDINSNSSSSSNFNKKSRVLFTNE